MNWMDISVVVAYFLAVLFVGIKASLREDKEGFLIGNRKVKSSSLNATISASLTGGSYLAAYVAFVYLWGVSAFWLILSVGVGLLVFIPIAVKAKRMGDEKKHYTFLDYFSDKWGRNNTTIAAVLFLLMFLCLIVSETIIGGKLFAMVTGWPYWVGVAISSLIVLAYVSFGGFKSDVKTDISQYIMIFLLIIIGFSLFNANSLNNVSLDFFSAGIGTIVGLVLIGILGIFVSADVWQRAYSAKDVPSLKKGFIWAAISFVFIGVIMTVIGLIIKSSYPDVLPNDALIYGFSKLPAGLLGIGLIAIISATMSTIDTCLLVGSMFISRDILSKYNVMNLEDIIRVMRISIIVLAVASAVLAVFFDNLVNVFYNAFNFALILAPPGVASFFFNIKRKAIGMSLITGIISAIALIVLNQLSADMVIVPFAVSLVFLIIGQIFFRKDKIIENL